MTARKNEPAPSSADKGGGAGPALVSLDAALFSGVTVKLDARLGCVSMSVQQLLALKAGEVVTLDSQLNDLVELHLNGALVGRGEIVAVDDFFGVRIVDISTAS